MPNCYARVADLKTALTGTSTANDAVYLRLLESVSRAWDRELNRHFYSLAAQTRYYPEERRDDRSPYRELWLPQDFIALTTVKVDADGDGVYEMTLAANTDYWTYPYNRGTHEPVQRLDLNPDGNQLGRWPLPARSVQIVGKAGYSEETQAAGTTAEALDTSETGVDLTAGHDVGVGDTLIIGSEQMDVVAMTVNVTPNVATVTRGVNGTTAAAHDSGATVLRRRYPRDIEEATIMQAARLFRARQSGGAGDMGNAPFGVGSFPTLYPIIRDLIEPYRLQVVA